MDILLRLFLLTNVIVVFIVIIVLFVHRRLESRIDKEHRNPQVQERSDNVTQSHPRSKNQPTTPGDDEIAEGISISISLHFCFLVFFIFIFYFTLFISSTICMYLYCLSINQFVQICRSIYLSIYFYFYFIAMWFYHIVLFSTDSIKLLPSFVRWPSFKAIYRLLALRWTCFLLTFFTATSVALTKVNLLIPSPSLAYHFLQRLSSSPLTGSLIAGSIEGRDIDELSLYFTLKLIELIASIDLKLWTFSSVIDLSISLFLIVKYGRTVPELILMKFFFQDTIYLMENVTAVLKGMVARRERLIQSRSNASTTQRRPDNKSNNRFNSWFIGILCFVVYLFIIAMHLCDMPLSSTSATASTTVSSPWSMTTVGGLCERGSSSHSTSSAGSDKPMPFFIFFCCSNVIFCIGMIIAGIYQMVTIQI